MFGKVEVCLVVGLAAAFIGGCWGNIESGGSGGGGAGGSGGSGGSAGAGGGIPCGGFPGVLCAETEYCDYPNDICGAADGQGICKPRSQFCPEVYSPTCACNGMVYGNDCEAAGAGFDVSNLGCMAPELTLFSCGYTFCDKATQYCSKTYSDVGGLPDSYSCAPLPAACGNTPSCMCIGDPCGSPIAGVCEATMDGGFRVTCPGG